MKKGLLFIAIMTIGMASNYVNAQGLFVKLNTGYSLSTNNSGNYYNTTYTEDGFTRELVNRSLSTGLNFGGSVGYMFNANLGFELGLSWLKSTTSTALYEDTVFGDTGQEELFSSMLRIAPSFVLIADMIKLNPYARFGIVLGSGKITEGGGYSYEGGKKSLKASNAEFDNMYEFEYSGGLAFGFSGSIGVLYGFSEKLSFFGEVNFSNMSYSPEKGKLTKAIEDGLDILDELSIRDKEVVFVDKLTYNWEQIQPEDEPSKQLKRSFPLGNYGVNFGIRIGL